MAASRLSGVGVRVISIDCTVETSLCSERHVHSYPAIRLFGRGDFGRASHRDDDDDDNDDDSEKAATIGVRYRGPRHASSIISFALRASMPALSQVDSLNISSLLGLDRNAETDVFILYLPPSSDESDEYKLIRSHFIEVAERYRFNYVFGISEDAKLAQQETQQQTHQVPTLIGYKPFVNDRTILPLENVSLETLVAVENFITSTGEPLIGELTRQTEKSYLEGVRPLVYIFVTTDEQRMLFRRALYPLAKKYSEYLAFLTIDAEEYGHMAGSLGIQKGIFPALTVYSSWKDQVFPFPGEVLDVSDAQVIQKVADFVLEILQGKVESWSSAATDQQSAPEGHDEL